MGKKDIRTAIEVPSFSATYRQLAAQIGLTIVLVVLSSCSKSNSPAPAVIRGSVNQTSFLLLDWPQHLRILIWDDILEGEHHHDYEGSMTRSVYRQRGTVKSVDGRAYEYRLGTRDGKNADFTIDGISYDLNQGRMFLIRTAGGIARVEQLDIDLSGLWPTNTGIADFGLQIEEISHFIQSNTDPEPRPTATVAVANDPTSTAYLQRNLDVLITASATTPDNSFWYAFDEFDDAGGSPPYSKNLGLYRRKDGLVTHFDVPGPIRTLAVDPDGDLYVGAACGVKRFQDDQWETLLDPDCDRRTTVKKLFPLDIDFEDDGTVWVGGAFSLARFSRGSWTEFDIPAMRVAVAADGTVWARGWDGRANSACCLTHLIGAEPITYTWTSDVPAEPEVLDSLFDRSD